MLLLRDGYVRCGWLRVPERVFGCRGVGLRLRGRVLDRFRRSVLRIFYISGASLGCRGGLPVAEFCKVFFDAGEEF